MFRTRLLFHGLHASRSKPKRKKLKFVLLVVASLVISIPHVNAQSNLGEDAGEPLILHLAVLTTEGATRAIEAWEPTVDLLNREAVSQDLSVRFRLAPHSRGSLSEEIVAGNIDIFLADPATFVMAEADYGARALLSIARMWQDKTYDRSGALVFTRSDSPLREFRQLEGRKVMAVTPNDFSGWWLAKQEFRKHRIEPGDVLSNLMFSGGNQREVVYAVQSGLVDAGVVRAGLLEKLSSDGAIDLSDFAPISLRNTEASPFWVSTPLYPEWVLSALPDVPEPALGLIINTLLAVSTDSDEAQAAGGLVWQAPQNLQPVHDLLISLRVPPYENYLTQALARIYKAYRLPILASGSLILLSLVLLLFQTQRSMRLAESRRNVLQSAVRSKKFYRNAIEQHTVFCMLDLEGRISHVNESFCNTTSRRQDELLNQPLATLLPEHEQALLKNDIMTSIEVGVPWSGSLKILKKDNSLAWAQCMVVPVSGVEEKVSEIAIVATDMTKTRQGISEDKFNDTLELIGDQVVVLRPKTLEILYCNRAAVRLLITSRMGGEWKGKNVSNFITETDLQALEIRCDSLTEGVAKRITWETSASNGTPYEISLEYVEPDQDEPRLIAIYRDISQRKIAEKAKSEFIATVSHELRTPLTSMKGALNLVMSGAIGEMPEAMKNMVSIADTSCDRLSLLVDDILDLEKIEAGNMDFNMARMDVAELIETVVESNTFNARKQEASIRMNLEGVDGGFFTLGDFNRLMQVMDNLLSNALKFSEKGGEVVVSLVLHKGFIRLSVKDFGSGIPEDSREKIFERFTQADSSDTRAKGGTGLGLAIARKIVDEHEGSIFFESEEGVGTEFFVDLVRMVNDEVVPVERPAIEDEETQLLLNRKAESGEDDQPAVREEGLHMMLAELRKRGLLVEIEAGSIDADQVAKGRGILGQSSILSWLSKNSRQLMANLLDEELLENRKVVVVQAEPEPGSFETAAERDAANSDVCKSWLIKVAEHYGVSEVGDEAPLNILSVASNGNPAISGNGISVTRVVNIEQATALASNEPYDLITYLDQASVADSMTILPVSGGRLPNEFPIMLIATRWNEIVAKRGVVSKFARRSGSGRGKAPRRA